MTLSKYGGAKFNLRGDKLKPPHIALFKHANKVLFYCFIYFILGAIWFMNVGVECASIKMPSKKIEKFMK